MYWQTSPVSDQRQQKNDRQDMSLSGRSSIRWLPTIAAGGGQWQRVGSPLPNKVVKSCSVFNTNTDILNSTCCLTGSQVKLPQNWRDNMLISSHSHTGDQTRRSILNVHYSIIIIIIYYYYFFFTLGKIPRVKSYQNLKQNSWMAKGPGRRHYYYYYYY